MEAGEDMVRAETPPYRSANGRRLHERVVRFVARSIVSGELASGATLPTETELAQRFEVSRTVIREAARILVAKGLVSVKHGRGMSVEAPERWHHLDPLVLFEQVRTGRGDNLLNELLEVRRVLEGEAAALAAERRTDEDVAALRADVVEMTAALEMPERFARLDMRFHGAILDGARNRLLGEALRPVAEVLEAGRLMTTRLIPDGAARSLEGHEEILAAVSTGEVGAAREAMRRHILQFEDNVRSVLQVSGPVPQADDRDGEGESW